MEYEKGKKVHTEIPTGAVVGPCAFFFTNSVVFPCSLNVVTVKKQIHGEKSSKICYHTKNSIHFYMHIN